MSNSEGKKQRVIDRDKKCFKCSVEIHNVSNTFICVICHRRTHALCASTEFDDASARKLRSTDSQFHFTCCICTDLVKSGAYAQNLENIHQSEIKWAKEMEKIKNVYEERANKMLSDLEAKDKNITEMHRQLVLSREAPEPPSSEIKKNEQIKTKIQMATVLRIKERRFFFRFCGKN